MKIFISLLLLATPLHAHGAIYKCTDEKGRTSYQETPCVAGNQSEIDYEPREPQAVEPASRSRRPKPSASNGASREEVRKYEQELEQLRRELARETEETKNQERCDSVSGELEENEAKLRTRQPIKKRLEYEAKIEDAKGWLREYCR